jgi:2',3'-cyclic-nucleotide 2'-phosphodiesterase (5'-nucleotidase family)
MDLVGTTADERGPLHPAPATARPAGSRNRSLLALVVCCLGLSAALAAAADTVEVLILQTTDVHGYLDSSDALPDGGGGWLRLATLVRRHAAAFGRDRTLVIDCGDSCQGTPVATLSQGQVGIDLIRAIGYDVWVPGNHELDFGVRRCAELCAGAGNRVLCGNLELTVDAQTQRFPAWRMIERGKARVAVIGATASYLAQWLWGTNMDGYKVEPAMDLLRRVMPEVLRGKPDMIVLAIHQGWLEADPRQVNEIAPIVERFPEIDLILGGHTHRTRPGMRLGVKTWYVQAGMHGSHMAEIKATLDVENHEVVDITSRLVPAAPDVPPDPDAVRAVATWQARVTEFSRQRVGTLENAVPAAGRPGENCATSELLCQAIAAATGAQAVLHGKLTNAGLRPGAVTEQDLFFLVPFENSLATAMLTRAELAEAIEEQWTTRNSLSYNGPWGVRVTVARDGKVVNLGVGAEVATADRIRVALNSYVVAGGGGRFPRLREILRRPETQLRDTGTNSRDAVREFLKTRDPIHLEPRAWVVRQAR